MGRHDRQPRGGHVILVQTVQAAFVCSANFVPYFTDAVCSRVPIKVLMDQ